ncbi:hypothetical protein MN0502_02480 [Arthrobacter sp. MN05-02]|nr:hypothetical protein MN0502_02480 [Arthrobacter sp. MN05-02]
MNPFDQQWRTANAMRRADLTIDDVWLRYFSMGGTADGVAVASYLHGLIMLDALQRDLLTYAVEELTTSSPPGRKPDRPADHPDDQGHSSSVDIRHPGPWPILRVRVTDMFDPWEAERHRKASLQRTGLLTAEGDERFNRFTRAARDTFNVNSSTISLITGTEQIIMSLAGDLGRDLSREMSFCTHTILHDQALVIPDATKDDRFRTNPLVTGQPNLRFYAGHPLTGPGGWRIGVLSLLDLQPRTFTQQDHHTLKAITNHVQAEILAN